MSCEYCNEKKALLKKDVMSPSSFGWGNPEVKINQDECIYYPLGVIVDLRGYLRLVDLEDYNCIEAGQKIKIKFCPMCGMEIN